jgi:hypothetical protein
MPFDLAVLPACLSDDGSGPLPCHWDAALMGNGVGDSFTVAADGTTTYDAPASMPVAELTGVLMVAVVAATVLVRRRTRSH